MTFSMVLLKMAVSFCMIAVRLLMIIKSYHLLVVHSTGIMSVTATFDDIFFNITRSLGQSW